MNIINYFEFQMNAQLENVSSDAFKNLHNCSGMRATVRVTSKWQRDNIYYHTYPGEEIELDNIKLIVK